MTRFVLHAGLSKTATTTIQNALYAKHSDIFYLGKSSTYPSARGARNQYIYNMVLPIFTNEYHADIVQQNKRLLYEHVITHASLHQIIVGSWEGMGVKYPEKFSITLEYLSELFTKPYKIMITIRHPVQWIGSLYLQELFGNYIHRNKFFSDKPFINFNDWISHRNYYRTLAFEYAAINIQQAIAKLGRKNIGVFVYEDLLYDPKNYYAQVCNFLEIDYEECMQLVSHQRYNPRITHGMLGLMQHTQASAIRRLAWMARTAKSRKRTLAEWGMHNMGSVHPTIGSRLEHVLHEASRKHFDYFNEEFHLGLERYNYPLTKVSQSDSHLE